MSIRVEIEGKGQVAEFPDGTDQSIIDAAIKRDFFGGNQQQAARPDFIKDMSGTEKFLTGTGYGMWNVGKGVQQVGASIGEKLGLFDKGTTEQIKQEREIARQQMEPLLRGREETGYAHSIYGQKIPITSKVGTPANVGKFVGETAPFIPLGGGVTGGALRRMGTSAATGAVQGAVLNEEDPLRGAIVGGLTGGATSGVMSAVGKGANTVLRKPTINDTQKLANYYGIRTTLGEVKNNPLIQKMETWLENVPFIGLQGFRQKQYQEAENAGKEFINKFIVNPNASDVMATNRSFASALYNSLDQKVSGVGQQIIRPDATNTMAKRELQSFSDLFKRFQNTNLERKIKEIVGDTSSTTKTSPILTQGGRPYTSIQPPQTTFADMWELRSGLGDLIGQARKKLASGDINKTELAKLNGLYSSVNRDIESWTNAVGRPDIKDAITAANDAYKRYVVKYDILERAWAKATGEKGAGEIFSPKKFSTALKAIAYDQKKGKYNTFTNREIEEMTGLANIMQVVKRSGQYMENPPTGNRWGMPLVGLGILEGSIGTASGVIPSIGIARLLTGTETGKRLVMSASKIEPNSPAMRVIVNQIYNQLPKFANTFVNQGGTE